MSDFIKELKELSTKVVGMKESKAGDLINDMGHNYCIVRQDNKLFNEKDSCGTDYIYVTVEKGIITEAVLHTKIKI